MKDESIRKVLDTVLKVSPLFHNLDSGCSNRFDCKINDYTSLRLLDDDYSWFSWW